MQLPLLDLLRKESTISRRRLLVLAIVAGLSNALILVVVNQAAEQAYEDAETSYRYLIMFVVVLVAYVRCQREVFAMASSEIDNILYRIQVRLAEKISRAEFLGLEEIGRSRIYASITKEMQTIASTGTTIVATIQSLIVTAFTLTYMAFLSITALFICVVFTVIAILVLVKRLKLIVEKMTEAGIEENKLFDKLTHFLDGFKEVKMNSRRSEDLLERFKVNAAKVRDLRNDFYNLLSSHFVHSQTTFYLLMATMVFLVPKFSDGYADNEIVKGTAAILFLIGPLTAVIHSIPAFTAASVSAMNIMSLEVEIAGTAAHEIYTGREPKDFKEITLENVVFSFKDEKTDHSFTVGPINLTINKGELLYIAGGNGTGKSTLLRLLTGLYFPQSGTIYLDGVPLSRINHRSYRDLFSTVFSDYHLFDRLYGLQDVEADDVRDLLELYRIADKTDVVDGEFETIDLSGGQRKRIGMIVALLEQRPIIVLDECAADQDPEFRKFMYEGLLQDMKKDGKTVIVVTHDDKYFDTGDRLLKMEDGHFVSADPGSGKSEA